MCVSLDGSLRPTVRMVGPILRCKTREPSVVTSNQDRAICNRTLTLSLTNSFEEAPPRDFVTAMRGYDRQQVDEHIRQIEAEVRQHREQAQALERELSEAHRQIQEQERPTYSGLGARIEQLLRLAEEQATELVQAARIGSERDQGRGQG